MGAVVNKTDAAATPANASTSTAPVLRGRVRINQTLPVVGLSRTKVHDLVSRGEFPAPVRLSAKCSLYDGQAVSDWIADPLGWIERNKAATAAGGAE